MANIESDQGFIGGKTTENAQRALAAAEKLGLDPSVVQTTLDGFVVPVAVLDEFENPKAAAKKSAAKTTAKATAKATTKEE